MDPFWINDPNILFKKWDIIPCQKMSNSERLNALTRLLIIITAIMYFMGNDQYFTVFALGILLIIVLKGSEKENFTPKRGGHDPCHTCGSDSSMAYINTKYETTPVNQYSHINDGLRSYTHAHYHVIPVDTPAPYREIWRAEPRWCPEFSQYPNTYNIIPQPGDTPQAYRYIQDNFSQPSNKCHYEDREWVENTPTGKGDYRMHSARPAIESAFMRDSSEFRNNIMGDYIDQIERTRQHGCVGFKPGRKTW